MKRPEYIIGGILIVLLVVGVVILNATPSQTKTASDIVALGNNPYKEIVDPSGFVNTESITLGQLVGEKVILVDFLTYSCINCQRTFPYLNAWYEKYKDQGLEIVGIHTPEFAFEKDINNVREAMENFGIKYPIVLDNDYATWRAYGNRYWPRKYLIDIHGNVVYDHIGEGAYEETEEKIQELLADRAEVLGIEIPDKQGELAASGVPKTSIETRSPETYLGAFRNEYLANGTPGQSGDQTFVVPETLFRNALYLGGNWNIESEYAESVDASSIVYKYYAKEVYIVADADTNTEMEVWQDGKLVGESKGADVSSNGVVTVKESRLYKLIKNATAGEHTLELKVHGKGARFYAFTFG